MNKKYLKSMDKTEYYPHLVTNTYITSGQSRQIKQFAEAEGIGIIYRDEDFKKPSCFVILSLGWCDQNRFKAEVSRYHNTLPHAHTLDAGKKYYQLFLKGRKNMRKMEVEEPA